MLTWIWKRQHRWFWCAACASANVRQIRIRGLRQRWVVGGIAKRNITDDDGNWDPWTPAAPTYRTIYLKMQWLIYRTKLCLFWVDKRYGNGILISPNFENFASCTVGGWNRRHNQINFLYAFLKPSAGFGRLLYCDSFVLNFSSQRSCRNRIWYFLK